MDTMALLEEIKSEALRNPSLKEALLATRGQANPLSAFCKVCRSFGYEIYEMDILSAGEDQYAAMRRSTNGGGENSPMLEGEDDYYELFFTALG